MASQNITDTQLVKVVAEFGAIEEGDCSIDPFEKFFLNDSIVWDDSGVVRETSTPNACKEPRDVEDATDDYSIIIITDEEEDTPDQCQKRIINNQREDLLHQRELLTSEKRRIKEKLCEINKELKNINKLKEQL